jgi:hypothetical protein
MNQLSKNAQLILNHLQVNGGTWMYNLIEVLYPKPKYESNPEAQRTYWQWETNAYGREQNRPVGMESVLFVPENGCDYSSEVSKAYQELRKSGLAGEKNNGYNEYWIYSKRK